MIRYDREEVLEPRMSADGEWERNLVDIKHHYMIGNIVFVYSQQDAEFEEVLYKDELPREVENAFQPMPEKEFVFHRELFDMIFSEYFKRRTSS